MPATNTSSHHEVIHSQPFNKVDKNLHPNEVKYRLWLVFKLFTTYVPVPNGELEIEDVAALFDELAGNLDPIGQSKSVDSEEKGDEHV